MKKQDWITNIMKTLKERGRFKSPEEVDDFFEKSLEQAYKKGGADAIQKMQLGKKLEEHYINLWNNL